MEGKSVPGSQSLPIGSLGSSGVTAIYAHAIYSASLPSCILYSGISLLLFLSNAVGC
ncbi:hypothetical protein GQ43DRAFT_445459 [Delitschia confertaspora ATCC 74209]|uniref:Uncharacterized protein n=1 Tax=Delitschia confertaspora ATCC 74209 TaxID=1513339 RepID=A0A9P4JB61_9PLEO|nr:hypothetical protein GQ43DRAFT_445459 [Delitschia confertaspora ATCC 74209]